MISGGESDDGMRVLEEDPTWRFTTVSVSSHAAKNGSQYRVWMEGRPSFSGFSVKATARKPRPALARISAAAVSTSASHGIWQAIRRSGWRPTHSSATQVL